MKTTIGEINIICTNLERSLFFYRDVLGFEILEEEGSGWHMRHGEMRFLLIGVASEASPRSGYCERAEFSIDLMVDDLGDAWRHFNEHHVEMINEFPPDGGRFFIRDTDGLVFEIIQALE